MISVKWFINLNEKNDHAIAMLVVVIYNEFINETLNLFNLYIHTHIYSSEA